MGFPDLQQGSSADSVPAWTFFFSPGVGATLGNYVPDLILFAFGNWNDGVGVSAEDVVIFFDQLFKLPKQNTQPLEELRGVRGHLPRR